jgi:hypothetical protein
MVPQRANLEKYISNPTQETSRLRKLNFSEVPYGTSYRPRDKLQNKSIMPDS